MSVERDLELEAPPQPEARPARVFGAVLHGVVGHPVEVEVRISSMLPRVDLVGLPETAVRESAARVRAAIQSLGLAFPDRRVTVNLAPASLPKGGAGLDLPIAVGILAAMGAVPAESLGDTTFVGELALDGRLRAVPGALSMARSCGPPSRGSARRATRAVFPTASAAEASFAPGLTVLAADHLEQVVAFLVTGAGLRTECPAPFEGTRDPALDLRDVRGQSRAKRALVIAAAGRHGLFLSGPPGCGKTMLARRLPGLLPPPALQEALEITEVYSAAGKLPEEQPLCRTRPFRAPHHTASRAGLLGGGTPPLPGEVSLAHRGVLFLDEFAEFERGVREALRQVLEERRVTIARVRRSATFPADFQLVAAANPCPCGWLGSRWRVCVCEGSARRRYQARLSGPLLDRIDLFIALPSLAWRELSEPAGEGALSSETLGEQVGRARARAAPRLAAIGIRANSEIPDAQLDGAVRVTAAARDLLGRATEKLRLSARGARRVLRVARTIADLRGETETGSEAVGEALSYRSEERG